MTPLAREAWERGIAPAIATEGLLALRDALKRNDPRLIRGSTTSPNMVTDAIGDMPCEGACPIVLSGWPATGAWKVADAERYFADVMAKAAATMGDEASPRHFLVWVDVTPRARMIRQLLEAVEAELAGRAA